MLAKKAEILTPLTMHRNISFHTQQTNSFSDVKVYNVADTDLNIV